MSTRPNEQWWAQHGAHWVQEIEKRKESQVHYLLQEAFLSAYFSRLAPARVMEFGCGFGRHLKYLREIPGLDVVGVDQSPTMLEAIGAWADAAWRGDHLTLIKAGQTMPFPDKSFDVVFTCSVMIHIQPDDVRGVLRELVRVCRGHLLHLENPPVEESVLRSQEHNGCWSHPLHKVYQELGAEVEILPPIGMIQGLYRATVGPQPPGPFVDNLNARLRAIHEMHARLLAQIKAAMTQRDQKPSQLGGTFGSPRV